MGAMVEAQSPSLPAVRPAAPTPVPGGCRPWTGPPRGMRKLAFEFARRVLKGEWADNGVRVIRMAPICRAVDLPENQWTVWRERYDVGKRHQPFHDAWIDLVRAIRDQHATAMELVADKVGLGAGTDAEIKGSTDRWKVLEQLGRYTPSSKLQVAAERTGAETQVELFEGFLAECPQVARRFDRWLEEKYAAGGGGDAA